MEAEILAERNGNTNPVPRSGVILRISIPESHQQDSLYQNEFVRASVKVIKTLMIDEVRRFDNLSSLDIP